MKVESVPYRNPAYNVLEPYPPIDVTVPCKVAEVVPIEE
jgi:hypothetical protein